MIQLPVEILHEAEHYLMDGRDFYDQCERGAGSLFLEQMESETFKLSRLYGFHKEVYGFHYLIAKRFPYGIYYLVGEEVIKIAAFLDLRQDPDSLESILKSRSNAH